MVEDHMNELKRIVAAEAPQKDSPEKVLFNQLYDDLRNVLEPHLVGADGALACIRALYGQLGSVYVTVAVAGGLDEKDVIEGVERDCQHLCSLIRVAMKSFR